MVQEWITSREETRRRISVFMGRNARLSTSRRRKSPCVRESVGNIYESNFKWGYSEYEYLQYHWCPITFKVIAGAMSSSKRYNK